MWLGWMHGMVMMMAYLLKGNDILLCSFFFFKSIGFERKVFWVYLPAILGQEFGNSGWIEIDGPSSPLGSKLFPPWQLRISIARSLSIQDFTQSSLTSASAPRKKSCFEMFSNKNLGLKFEIEALSRCLGHQQEFPTK